MSSAVSSLLWTLLGAAIGAVITFFATRRYFQKQIDENPPVNEKMIRAMYMSMGRKPSEAQIHQVMKSMGIKETGNNGKKDTKEKKKK